MLCIYTCCMYGVYIALNWLQLISSVRTFSKNLVCQCMSYLYYVNICVGMSLCRVAEVPTSMDFRGLDLRTSWSLFSGAGNCGEAWLILASGCGTWWKKYMKSYDSLWMLIQCLSDTGSGLMFTDSEFGGRPFACSTLTCSSGAAIAKAKTLHGSICKLYYPEKQKLLFLQRNRKTINILHSLTCSISSTG